MAIDTLARGLAASIIGTDGKIASDKRPVMGAAPSSSVFTPVGSLTDVTQIEGKTAEEILAMMLFGTVNPTLTNPSFSAKLTNADSIKAGRVQTLTGQLVFNRGKINPAYGTSGYRAGAPIEYQIGAEKIATNATTYNFTVEITPIAGVNTLECQVSYGAGEQPLNSAGEPYSTALPAGTLKKTLSFNASYPLYSGTGASQEYTYFKDGADEGYEIQALSEGSGTRQSFAVAADVTVLGVKQYDVISQSWLWIGGDPETSLENFDTTTLTAESLDEELDYILYTYNGAQAGERKLRICVTYQ